MLVVPPVAWVVADDPRLAHEAVLGHLGANEVAIGHGRSVSHGDGVFEDGLDGSPHVDNLVPPLHEGVGLGGELPP